MTHRRIERFEVGVVFGQKNDFRNGLPLFLNL